MEQTTYNLDTAEADIEIKYAGNHNLKITWTFSSGPEIKTITMTSSTAQWKAFGLKLADYCDTIDNAYGEAA